MQTYKITYKENEKMTPLDKCKEAVFLYATAKMIGKQIASLFNLDGVTLGNQLCTHYSEILERREKVRIRLGFNDNFL